MYPGKCLFIMIRACGAGGPCLIPSGEPKIFQN